MQLAKQTVSKVKLMEDRSQEKGTEGARRECWVCCRSIKAQLKIQTQMA